LSGLAIAASRPGGYKRRMVDPVPTAAAQPDADLQLGVQMLQLGRIAEAELLLRQAHARLGERPDVLHFLAVALAERGNHGEAEQLWRRAIARDPREALLHFNLGVVLHGQGRIDAAIPCYRSALRLREFYPEAWSRLAAAYMDLGRFSAAEREYRRLAETLQRMAAQADSPVVRQQQRIAQNGLGYAL
jgi:tetratricopeptide (TPR) repeat protein